MLRKGDRPFSMLSKLFIRNLATIENMEVSFEKGLNALTGETGAGKSIVVGGLELALGERPGSNVIRSGTNLALAEAHFLPPFPPRVKTILTKELELEYGSGESLVLRRELSRKGKNRCFINDQMVAAGELKRVGELLVDFHGQHEHQSLFHTPAHLAALDAFGGHRDLIDRYSRSYNEVQSLRRRKRELDDAARDFEKRLDYLNYQIEEIENLDPKPGEIAELEQEEKRLAHAETLARAAADAYALLYEGDEGKDRMPVIQLIDQVSRLVDEIAEVEPGFTEPASSLGETRVSLQELAFSLRDYSERTNADPGRLDELIARLESLRHLTRKHGGTEESLFAALEEMKKDRAKMTRDDAERREIDGKLDRKEKGLEGKAAELSRKRKKAEERFSKKIMSLLEGMAMKKARFTVSMSSLDRPGPEGMDRVEFLLAANPGLPAAPLRKVASGGELSRVMLAIKSMLADRDAIPTMIFDEIDAGISGETCGRVGRVMEKLAASHQLICITHHAPIAARAGTHVSVRKTTRRGRTFTELVPLAGKTRLEELARMLGGKDTAAALDLARELLPP